MPIFTNTVNIWNFVAKFRDSYWLFVWGKRDNDNTSEVWSYCACIEVTETLAFWGHTDIGKAKSAARCALLVVLIVCSNTVVEFESLNQIDKKICGTYSMAP